MRGVLSSNPVDRLRKRGYDCDTKYVLSFVLVCHPASSTWLTLHTENDARARFSPPGKTAEDPAQTYSVVHLTLDAACHAVNVHALVRLVGAVAMLAWLR